MSGVTLPNGCRVTHGTGAAMKTPFPDMPLSMHELAQGGDPAFGGQFGFIPFSTAIRLPRHVHAGAPDASGSRRLLAERILVLNGGGLVELAGEIWLAAPGSLVEIAAGVPHSWTACPAGVRLPDGTATDGTFLMVYHYEAPTGFSPVETAAILASAAEVTAFVGDLEAIRIRAPDAAEIVAARRCVWNDGIGCALALA